MGNQEFLMSNIYKLDDDLLSQAKKPSTIGATHVSLASSECIKWVHDAMIIKPTNITHQKMRSSK
jgi:hypothetical protein|tara:strand:+ start:201 stop:395 length:195 start_codon:yes stop_codon:yes gene_type:complete